MSGAVALAALALAPHYVALPSGVAPLSLAPPLGNGAAAANENVRHRVTARTTVRVSVTPAGTPFAVVATQRLDVRILGDYFFTIGAPVRDVARAPGSEADPGLRATAILWAGFNPGRRVLAARATLEPAATAPALPLRVQPDGNGTRLVNATRITVSTYAATALRDPLEQRFAQIRRDVARGNPASPGGAYLTTPVRPTKVAVASPLLVDGTIGGRRVHRIVEDSVVVQARGRVRLTITPQLPERLLADGLDRVPDDDLLLRVSRTLLTLARVKQYETFLGNPDPTGRSSTTYLYETRTPPPPPAAVTGAGAGRDWALTLLVALGGLAVLWVGIVAWARA
jgi:hypothetical protein